MPLRVSGRPGTDVARGVVDEGDQLLQEEGVAAGAGQQVVAQLRGHGRPVEGDEQLLAGGRVEGVEVDDQRVVTARRRGPHLAHGLAGGAEHDHGAAGEALEQGLDQPQQVGVGPVDVGEAQGDRTPLGVALDEGHEGVDRGLAGPRRVAPTGGRVVAHQDHQAVGDPVELLVRRRVAQGGGHAGPHRGVDRVRRRGGLDLALAVEGLGQRPPHVGLAVGHAASVQHEHVAALLERCRRLAHQAGLAHPGVADDQRDERTRVAERRGDGAVDQPELAVAAHQGGLDARRALPGRHQRLERGPRLDRRVAAAGGEEASPLVVDGVGGEVVGGGADQHLAGTGRGLEPAGGVDDVAHRRGRAAGAQGADQDLAGVDPDAHLHPGQRVRPARPPTGDRGQGGLHAQRGADGALRVVLVGDRGPEQGEDAVADDLVDPTPELGDVGDQELEPGVDQPLHPFGVERLGQAGEADDVGEHDGDHPSLVPMVGRLRVAARRAEAGPGRDRLAALGALHGGESTATIPPRRHRSGRSRDVDVRPRPPEAPGRVVATPSPVPSRLPDAPRRPVRHHGRPHLGRRPSREGVEVLRPRRHRRVGPLRGRRGDRAGALHRGHGPVGIGQVDPHALPRRPRLAQLRPGLHRRHRPLDADRQGAHPAPAHAGRASSSRPST